MGLDDDVPGEVKETVKSEDNSDASQRESGQQTVTMTTYNRLEPPAFISEKKSYSAYKKDLRMWSRITNVPKTSQAELVVYGLEGHPSGIKEKVIVNIGESLENAADGIDLLINFLDSIYKEDDMSAAWTKYNRISTKSFGPMMLL
jgi:hypothetical protein